MWVIIVELWLLVCRETECDDGLWSRAHEKKTGETGHVSSLFWERIWDEPELYGIDVIGGAVRINNVTGIDDDNMIDNHEIDDRGIQLNQLEQVESEEAISETADKKVNSSVSELRENEDGETEIESLVKRNGVILKQDEKSGMLKFNDQNGVLEHESGTSRRIDIEVKGGRRGCISKGENKTKEMAESQTVWSRNAIGSHRVSKLERGGVEKEMPKMVTVKSAKGGMRDLLLSEM